MNSAHPLPKPLKTSVRPRRRPPRLSPSPKRNLRTGRALTVQQDHRHQAAHEHSAPPRSAQVLGIDSRSLAGKAFNLHRLRLENQDMPMD